jgi:hypothetical protein
MKPGIKTIIAGAALFVLGAVVIPLLVILPLILGKSDEVQFKVPGTVQATVKEPGRYYVWNNFRIFYEGKNYDRSETIPDGIEIRIHNAKGEPLKFVSDTSTSATVNSSAKNSIGYVEVERPGTVGIEVTGGNEERVFSFSQSRFLKMFGMFLGGFGLAMLAGVGGFGIIIWGIVKLVRANKQGGLNGGGGESR